MSTTTKVAGAAVAVAVTAAIGLSLVKKPSAVIKDPVVVVSEALPFCSQLGGSLTPIGCEVGGGIVPAR